MTTNKVIAASNGVPELRSDLDRYAEEFGENVRLLACAGASPELVNALNDIHKFLKQAQEFQNPTQGVQFQHQSKVSPN
jgi:hypothetical protein